MDTYESMKAADDTLTSELEACPDVSLAAVRVLKLLTNALRQWSEIMNTENLASLTDTELLQKLAVSGAIALALNNREA